MGGAHQAAALLESPGLVTCCASPFAAGNQEQDLSFLYRLYNCTPRKPSLMLSKNELSASHPCVCMTFPHVIAGPGLAHAPHQLSTCLPVSPSGTGGIPNKLPPWLCLLVVVEFPPTQALPCCPRRCFYSRAVVTFLGYRVPALPHIHS